MKRWMKSKDLEKLGITQGALQGLADVGVLTEDMLCHTTDGPILSSSALGKMFDLLARSYTEMARLVAEAKQAREEIAQAIEEAPSFEELAEAPHAAEIVDEALAL